MGTEQPLVSICMPAYKVEQVVGEALASVLAQTYQNIEVVIVDDGSTDRTSEVIQSFDDARVRYIRNTTNLGGFQTMNKAVSLSRGDLIAIYHSDDIYEPTIIEKEVAYLQTHLAVGAVFCLDHYIDAKGRVHGGTTLPPEFRGREALNYQDVFPFLLRHKNILLRCPTFMARRAVLDAVGSFDAQKYDIAADLDMWIRIVRQFPIGILDERLMYYRHTQEQWSSRYKRLRTSPELFFAIMDYYLETDAWWQKINSKDLIEYAFHRCDDETFQAANWVILGEKTKACELLQKPYPWQVLLTNIKRRKLRVLLLRFLLLGGLSLRMVRPLERLLVWTEYGGCI